MLKKKLLLSLVIFQGILIVVGIIAIIFGIFYKINNSNSENNKINQIVDINQISLFDEKHYQQKIIKDGEAVFQIIEIKTNKIIREIYID
tara:strand:+ start:4987 stop:5256 length:270 start_codon:yes stop_codon:yes gene_type:complete